MSTKKVRIFDNQKRHMKDVLSADDKRPKGRVQIFDKASGDLIGESDNMVFPEQKLHDGPNLIVYSGRTWLMQRAFQQDLSPASGDSLSYLSWFGLGTGGATLGDPLDPVAPLPAETDLDTEAIINSTDPLCANSGALHPYDSIVYEQDAANENQYLIAKVTTTIGNTDANGASGTGYYDLSEAGLWISNTSTAASLDTNSLILFARVTFSTIRKHDEREIVFIWSIYF
jgi:hypothetical protein